MPRSRPSPKPGRRSTRCRPWRGPSAPWPGPCGRRHQILAAAYTALVIEGETTEAEWEAVEDAARTITRAGWWIDQRSSEPEDLTELLDAATEADRPTENPHF